MKRWMLTFFFWRFWILGVDGWGHQWTKKMFLKTHTQIYNPISPENLNFFFSKNEEGIFHWEPIISVLLRSVIYQSHSAPGKCVPRSDQYMFRVCTSCGGYMESRNSFCLFSSSLWRSGAVEHSDLCKVCSPRCEAPHARQWPACLTLLLTYQWGNGTWNHIVTGRSQR